jgi:hypothetical protein
MAHLPFTLDLQFWQLLLLAFVGSLRWHIVLKPRKSSYLEGQPGAFPG